MSLSFRALSLVLVWSVFIALAIGSKSYDPEEEIERDPVDYSVSISSIGNIVWEDGESTDTVSAVSLIGIINQAAGSAATLRPGSVSFGNTSEFDISVLPGSADNLLRGDISVEVSQALTFDDDRNAETGQLSIRFDGTTTLITFPSDSSDVQIQSGTSEAITISLNELRERFSDENQEINLRAASKSWSIFENLWLAARITETVQREIDDQLSMLTSMGRDQPLTLECDNPNATPTPERTLRWTIDATGTGSGEASNGDSFASTYRNCNLVSDSRFLQGDLTISSYNFLNSDDAPRQMSYDAAAANLFTAVDNIDISTPAPTRERFDGTLRINVLEPATTL